MRIQFILKRNEVYSFTHYCRRSSGLWNSVSFVSEVLKGAGFDVEQIEIQDNNDIDRNVTRFKPDIVIIEALWVVPEKFDVLKKLHPNVRWFIHMHSGFPFLAMEGIAMGWLRGYEARGIGILANSVDTYKAFQALLPDANVEYLPNTYTALSLPGCARQLDSDTIRIGCFGAVRPMKNHLEQAVAALQFARSQGQRLEFHVNGSRIEVGGQPCLKNLRQLFYGLPDARLVEWDWMELDDFISNLRVRIDIGMQVSMSETFNFVAANYVSAGIPMVVSTEIPWASRWSKVKDNSVESIVRGLRRASKWRCLVSRNRQLLIRASGDAQYRWFRFIESQQ